MTAASVSSTAQAAQTVGFMPMPASFSHKEAFLHGRPQHRKYDDFYLRHPPMDTGRRAKIFAPFDALRGFDFCIMTAQAQHLEDVQSSSSAPSP